MATSHENNATPSTQKTLVAVLGAGFAGLGMGIQLLRSGIHDFLILEAEHAIGGTWRDNTYPGCACDVPTHLYSYSFEPNPDWSRLFGEQSEILDYMKRCVKKYNLDKHLHFGARVTEARFDEASGFWNLQTQAGKHYQARVVVSATGPLNKPAYPAIQGKETFQGASFHSSYWDHSVDLQDKHVAVIGTGASAIQIVPAIAPKVAKLSLYQRTPPWILPKPDFEISDHLKRTFRALPALRWLTRAFIYWRMEIRALGMLHSPQLLRLQEHLARRFLKEAVPDPALREKLTPDYSMGCKRVLISNDYYPALQRPHVELVTDPIEAITPHGIQTQNGTHRPADVLVYATGFRVHDFIKPMKIYGLHNQELDEIWQRGSQAYLGVAVSGFPNFYLLVGPNTGLGHNSIIFMIEAQIHFILQCLQKLRQGQHRYLDILPERQGEFNQRLQQRLQNTVWKSGCQSWYVAEDGNVYTIWPGFTVEYWLRTRRLQHQDFRTV